MPCKKCETLELWLQQEIEEKKYFVDLLHKRIGITAAENEPVNDGMPVSRAVTLSAIRNQARIELAKRSVKPTVDVKVGQSLTEAEKIFEESINNG